jgi:hypothetical protein
MKLLWWKTRMDSALPARTPDVEALIASARPEHHPLTPDAADRLFQRALAEAQADRTAPVNASRRFPSWAMGTAGALATLVAAVGAVFLSNTLPGPDPISVKQPVDTPAVTVAPRIQPGTARTHRVAVAANPAPSLRRTPVVDGTARAGRADRRTVRPSRRTHGDSPRRLAVKPVPPRAIRGVPVVTDSASPAGVAPAADDQLAMLLVMVDPASDALRVDVAKADENTPGYARAAAYTPATETAAAMVTEATVEGVAGNETAHYQEGWYDAGGAGPVLHVSVTRAGDIGPVEEPDVQPDSAPALEPAVGVDSAPALEQGATPESEPGQPDETTNETLKELDGRGVEQ